MRDAGQIYGGLSAVARLLPEGALANLQVAADLARQRQLAAERARAEAARQEQQRLLNAQRDLEASLLAHARGHVYGAAPWVGAPHVREALGAGGQVRPDPTMKTIIVPPADPYATARVATNPSSPSVRAEFDATVTQTALTALQLTCAQWLMLDRPARLALARPILAGMTTPPATEMYTPGSMTTTMMPGTMGGPSGPGIPCIAGLPALPGFPPCLPGEPGKPGDRPSDIQGTIARAYQAAQRYIEIQRARRWLMSQGGTPEELVDRIDRHCGRSGTSLSLITPDEKNIAMIGILPGGLAATVLDTAPTLADANATLASLATAQTNLAATDAALATQRKRSRVLLGATVLVGIAGVAAYALKKPRKR